MSAPYIEFKDTPAQFRMIFVNEGEFQMGNNNESVSKKIPSFWIGEFLVTQGLWAFIMSDLEKSHPYYFKDRNRPVESISWNEIYDFFLPKLNTKTRKTRPQNTVYRLPTEAEWEYAAKGGEYYWKYPFEYAGSSKLEEVGWYDQNSYQETKDVGIKTPNLLGIYDMSGNVWDLCQNQKGYGFYVGTETFRGNTFRILRGGSWNSPTKDCDCLYSFKTTSLISRSYLGFRIVLGYHSV